MNLSQFLLIVFPDINPIQIDTVLCTIYIYGNLSIAPNDSSLLQNFYIFILSLYYSLLSLVITYWKIGAFQLFMLRAINYYFILYLVVSVSGTYWQLRYVIVYIRSKKLVSYHTNAWHLLYSIIDSILVASTAAFLLNNVVALDANIVFVVVAAAIIWDCHRFVIFPTLLHHHK